MPQARGGGARADRRCMGRVAVSRSPARQGGAELLDQHRENPRACPFRRAPHPFWLDRHTAGFYVDAVDATSGILSSDEADALAALLSAVPAMTDEQEKER